MKKFKFMLFASLLVATFADAKYIGTYYAKLGVLDHFNSHGTRLTKAAAIIRQDRYNFHIRNIKDSLDTWDAFFDSKRNRELLEKMLSRGNASSSALNSIVNGTPLIKVTIYDDHINVKVLKSAPKSSIR